MKRYYVDELPAEMRRSFFDTEYTVFDNDALIEAARIITPLDGKSVLVVKSGIRHNCSSFREALKQINEELWDFDLPDSLLEAVHGTE